MSNPIIKNNKRDTPNKIFLVLDLFLLSKLKTKQKVATTISSPVISNNLNPCAIFSPALVTCYLLNHN